MLQSNVYRMQTPAFTADRNVNCCVFTGFGMGPIVVDSFGTWGDRASKSFSRLASRLAAQTRSCKATVFSNLYASRHVLLFVPMLEPF